MSSKKSSSPPAATIVGGNEDLLIETLIHLPPKALLRFKAVSKRWRSLISSPFFRRLHTLRHRPESRQPPSFILGSDGSSRFFLLNSTTLTLSDTTEALSSEPSPTLEQNDETNPLGLSLKAKADLQQGRPKRDVMQPIKLRDYIVTRV